MILLMLLMLLCQSSISAGQGLWATGGSHLSIRMGSTDQRQGYKFEVELSSRGAAIEKVTLAEYPDLSTKARRPLLLIGPLDTTGSMSTSVLALPGLRRQVRLDRLDWSCQQLPSDQQAGQMALFEATVVDANKTPILRIQKQYRVTPGQYIVDVNTIVENLTTVPLQFYMGMNGPVGIRRESALADMPKTVAVFKDNKGQILSKRLPVSSIARPKSLEDLKLRLRSKPEARPLWYGIVNKYFAAILVPRPDPTSQWCDWLQDATATYANPDGDTRIDSGDETVGIILQTRPLTLAAKGEPNSVRTFAFELYLGPKDKDLFDKDPRFRSLAFVQVIDFAACCCPASIISPLAFLILAIMKGLYVVIHNYGLVIIVLVLLMRLIMHPVTRSSQMAMYKMSKLAPKAEEIRRRYANNTAEMQRQLMELYRQQGVSPIMSLLPMILQMPIWIALWTAVNISIDLRGKAFLPFWITDLAAPDALISLPKVLVIPLLGFKIGGLNLLPILMGIAFYLQQKLTPTQSSASANPQLAQQQKIMTWMMPILFPLMLYNTASGVNLYIVTSTFAGVWEQK
ncbi:MAG: YidC/Oxa1 family insertase periplasmic-domain containing protein, partial [Sedimentisphaerales bacterium]|nr:YidC/Oxa1 family insertase periplasmic-domain containing protein [Sedimentisphaerales bacterium]